MSVDFNIHQDTKYKYGFIGTCWDQGGCVGPSGQRTGPESVRHAMKKAWGRVQNGKILDVDQWRILDVADLQIKDFGNIEDYRVDDWKYSIDRIAENVGKVYAQKYVPVVVGGDCSIHYPAVKGLHDQVKGNVGVVYMDSHFDLWPEHPQFGRYSHASPCKNIMELDRVLGKNVVNFGMRGYGQPFFFDYIRQKGSTPITTNMFLQRGVEQTARDILNVINDGTEISVMCIDIDIIEGAMTPGTAGNEPAGPSPYEFQELVKLLAPHVDAIVITEVNDTFDVNGITAVQGAKIFNDFILYHYAGNHESDE